jgi:hypothetical protein
MYGTPVLALERAIVLMPGDSIAARTNGQEPEYQLGLTYLYHDVPKQCLHEYGKHREAK